MVLYRWHQFDCWLVLEGTVAGGDYWRVQNSLECFVTVQPLLAFLLLCWSDIGLDPFGPSTRLGTRLIFHAHFSVSNLPKKSFD